VGKRNRGRELIHPGEDAAESLMDDIDDVCATIATGDPLLAELAVSDLIHRWSVSGLPSGEVFGVMIPNLVVPRGTPEAAALLRILAILGDPAVRRVAGSGLGDLIEEGVYPPEWVTQIGKPQAIEAIRRYDIYGETEMIAVLCSADHGFAVQIVHMSTPLVANAAVVRGTDKLRETMTTEAPGTLWESISLGEARHRLAPVSSSAATAALEGNEEGAFLPLIAARVRRLPVVEVPDLPSPTVSDALAAVDEFMTGPQAQALPDLDAARSWAQMIAGYSVGRPGSSPDNVGPAKLGEIFGRYVPQTFDLDTQMRQAIPEVAQAWVDWAADRHGYDADVREHLRKDLAMALGLFDEAVDSPEAVANRRYVEDLTDDRADGALLRAALQRRTTAVPLPHQRTNPKGSAVLDASDPAARHAILRAEFADCAPPAGFDEDAFIEAVIGAADRLWDGEPGITARAAELTQQGQDGHDVLHMLVAEHR